MNSQDLLDRLYKCRDLELNLLWQRSIFLTAFIIAFLSAYGGIWIADKSYFVLENPIFHCIGMFIGAILFAFSVLWYQIAIGSKHWYEVYERKIEDLEADMGISGEMRNATVPNVKTSRYSLSGINISIGVIIGFISITVIAFHFLFLISFCCLCNCLCFCPIFEIFFLITFISFVTCMFLALSKNKRKTQGGNGYA